MNDGKLVFDVTHVRGFAEDLWQRMGDDGAWGKDIKKAVELITGEDGGTSGRHKEAAVDKESLATFGLSGHEYHGKTMGRNQAENLAALVKYAMKARMSTQELAKGAAVIGEKLSGQDAENGKAVEGVYDGFGESAPHGLYGGQ